MSPADNALFQQWLARRDADAFGRLARQYGGLVYAVGRRITGNAHDAEDIAQACFEKLAAQRRAPKAPLAAWLHRAATNQALNLLKTERRRRQREARFEDSREKRTEITWDDVYDLVDAAIAALPERQRVAVVAHYLEGKTHEAIAGEFGISRPAVTQRIHGGVAGIRASLRKRGVDVPLAALGALVAHDASAAAPAALAARLGKIGLSGYGGGGLWQGLAAALGGAKGLAVGVAVAAAAAGAGWLAFSPGDAASPPDANGDTPAVTAALSGSPQATPLVEGGAEAPATVATVALAAAENVAPEPTAPATGPDSRPGARIVGVVADTDGNPVAGAQVQLTGTEDLRRGAGWTSGADGAFEFANVAPADRCWVGTFTMRDGRTLRGSEMELKPVVAGETYDVSLTLYDGVISGRVLDSRARPMPGVEVLASPQWPYKWGLPTAIADEGGYYRVEGVMAGEFAMQIKPGGADYVETGVTVRSDGVGVRSEVNLTYRTPEGGTLHGRVLDVDGAPIGRAYVKINLTVAPHTSRWTFSDAEGHYQFAGIPEGPNLVHATHFDYGDTGARDVALDGDPVDLVLPPRGTVHGQVVDAATGEPIPAFEIHTMEPVSDIHYFMVSERWKPFSDAEGRFSLVLKPGGQPVRARAEGFSEATQSVQVPPGGDLRGVSVALKSAVAIRGVVVDLDTGKPIVGASIFRGSPPSGATAGQAIAHSGDSGEFTVADASPDGETLSATYPEYGPALAMAAPGDTSVTITMHAGIEVSGIVTVDGGPVEGAHVFAAAPWGIVAGTATDTEGRYTLRVLPRSGLTFDASIQDPRTAQVRALAFEPDPAWRPGREPLRFDFFVPEQPGAMVKVVKGGAPLSGLAVRTSQELGGGYREVLSGLLKADGTIHFENLAEGHWDIVIDGPDGKPIHLGLNATADEMMVLNYEFNGDK